MMKLVTKARACVKLGLAWDFIIHDDKKSLFYAAYQAMMLPPPKR